MLEFDQTALMEIQLALYVFQEAVSLFLSFYMSLVVENPVFGIH